jgi:cytoskeletal protein CcmA (bactofilin family)
MPETRVPRGGKIRLGTVNGDLRVDSHARIEVEGRLVVSGTASFEGTSEVVGTLECEHFRSDGGTVTIQGDVVVRGDMEAHDGAVDVRGTLTARRVDVDRGLRVAGPATADRFEVGGVLEGGQTLTARTISVGGKFRLAGKLEAQDVEVGGSVELHDVSIDRLEVGGLIRIGGGEVRHSIEVGGRFLAEGPLTFGSLDVGGFAEFRDLAKGGSIDVGGVFTAARDVIFTSLEIGGVGRIGGDGTGHEVEIGGKFDIRGAFALTGRVEVGGTIGVGGPFTGDRLEVGGKLDALRAVFVDSVEIGGSAQTREGLKAARIRLEHRSRVSGPVVGDDVQLERGARVEDVYGQRVELAERCEARRVVAANVRVRAGASVGEVVYSGTADIDPSARLGTPPRKVDTLPPFPL